MDNELKRIDTLEEVTEWNIMNTPGVYLFSKDGKEISEIGRSDTNVAAFLRFRAFDLKQRYNFFKIEPAYSPVEAFMVHCKRHHQYKCGEHPEPPKSQNWGCPVLGCEWEEKRKTRRTGSVFHKTAVLTPYRLKLRAIKDL